MDRAVTVAAPLRILLVEDSPADAELVQRSLRGLAVELHFRQAADEPTLRALLREFEPHVVLSDYSMPGFSGQAALSLVRELAPETPFIFVSGTIGEDMAIEALQRGAADYVLKENLLRLPAAIERALGAAEERRERLRVERALRASEERFRAIVESTADWMWEMDLDHALTYSNASVAAILGYRPEELVGQDALAGLVEEDRDAVLAALPDFVARGIGWRNWVLRWRHRDGDVRLLESTAQPLLDEDGRVVGFRGIDRDVTLRLQQEARIAQLGRIHAVLGALGNVVLRARDFRTLLDMTCRLAVEHGHFSSALIGLRAPGNRLELGSVAGDAGVAAQVHAICPIDLDGNEHAGRPAVRALLDRRNIIIGDCSRGDVPSELRDGMRLTGMVAQIALPIGSPPWGVLSLHSDQPQAFDADEIELLEQLTAEIDYARDFIAKSERLEYLAYHNPATGLPNRSAFRDLLLARLEQGPHLVAMADVDRFRYFNHSRGRGFGDRLLGLVGAGLQAQLPPATLFAHPGDDAFMFAYRYDGDIEAAVAEVEAILRQACAAPFQVDGEEVVARLQGSVLLAPLHDHDPESIERSLVAVLAEAQRQDRSLLPFTEEVRGRANRRVTLERELRHALHADEFELFLQPKFAVSSQRLCGAEALLRWRHPQRGLVSPGEFIAVLEESGLIVDAGAWVRREALRITGQWRQRGNPDLRLAVNVSARELRQRDFIAGCEQLLAPLAGEHGLDIEITESLLMDDIGHSIQMLQSLRDLGCRIAIDDFGTGYSSLNYLSRLPADTLKIDQSFIALLALSPDTLALVTNVIGLAHSLGLRVVAEGVEDEEQAKLLRLLRCDELQGYFLGRPMPVTDFERQFLS